MYSNSKAYIAEFIGTFALVFLGCAGVWVTTTAGYAAGPTVPAFAHGLAIVFAAYSLGHISGAHLNPAVTLACAIHGAIGWVKAAIYVVVQILAATLAAFVLSIALPNQAQNFGAFSFPATVPAVGAVVVEMILTFFLATAVLQGAVRGKAGAFAGLAIGLTLTASIFAGGAITGASLNPARSIGPAIVAGNFSQIWVYILGPLLGGALAAVVSKFVLNPDEEMLPIENSSTKTSDRPRTKGMHK